MSAGRVGTGPRLPGLWRVLCGAPALGRVGLRMPVGGHHRRTAVTAYLLQVAGQSPPVVARGMIAIGQCALGVVSLSRFGAGLFAVCPVRAVHPARTRPVPGAAFRTAGSAAGIGRLQPAAYPRSQPGRNTGHCQHQQQQVSARHVEYPEYLTPGPAGDVVAQQEFERQGQRHPQPPDAPVDARFVAADQRDDEKGGQTYRQSQKQAAQRKRDRGTGQRFKEPVADHVVADRDGDQQQPHSRAFQKGDGQCATSQPL